MMRLEVYWPDFLDAYQGFAPEDGDLWPCVRVDSGELTCRALMGDEEAQLLRLPVKGAKHSFEQREAFVDTLCDRQFAAALTSALSSEDPFASFDRVLSWVQAEETRWAEVQLQQDVNALLAWFRRADIEPDPIPTVRRTILEFPLKRAPDEP